MSFLGDEMRDLTWVHDALSSPPSRNSAKREARSSHRRDRAEIANVGPPEHKSGTLLALSGR
ncbi:hypothetical protein H0E87_028940, partial [Populus deltoides]